MTYADLGPPIPLEAPDLPPLRLTHIQELAQRTGLNEVVFLVDAMCRGTGTPVKLILSASPFSGAVERAAVCLRPGTGYVATSLECLPGNLLDIVASIVMDPRPG